MNMLKNGGIYKIVAPNGLVLSGGDFGFHECDRVVLQSYSHDLNQAWRFRRTSSGMWRLENLAAGLGLRYLQLGQQKHAPYRLFPLQLSTSFHLQETMDGWLIGTPGNALTVTEGEHQPVIQGEGTAFCLELIEKIDDELPRMLVLKGDIDHAAVPEIFRDGDWYYCVAGTWKLWPMEGRIGLLRSKDMIRWYRYDAFLPESKPRPFSWMEEHVPDCEIWCPGLTYFGGKYRIYYAVTRNCCNTSAMAQLTNVTLDKDDPRYAWKDEGIVMESTEADDWNAIDPHIIRTYENELWMVYGSALSGVKVRRIDEESGKVYDDNVFSVAYREEYPHPAEGGYVFKRDGWYYLICAVERTDQNYRTVVGRSPNIRGPYLDKKGVSLMDEGGETIVEFKRGLSYPGHSSVFQDDEKYYIIFENFYERCSTQEMAISTLAWKDGWPQSAAGRTVLGLEDE